MELWVDGVVVVVVEEEEVDVQLVEWSQREAYFLLIGVEF